MGIISSIKNIFKKEEPKTTSTQKQSISASEFKQIASSYGAKTSAAKEIQKATSRLSASSGGGGGGGAAPSSTGQSTIEETPSEETKPVIIPSKGVVTTKTEITQAPKIQTTIYRPGEIYQAQVDVEEYKGRQIPIYQTMAIGGDWTSRPATMEERDYLLNMVSAEKYKKTTLSPTKGKIKRTYGEISGKIQEISSEEIYKPEDVSRYFSKYGIVGEYTGGAITGLVPSTKGELIKTGAIFGIGAGVGFAFKAVPSIATGFTTKLLGAEIGALTGTGFKLATYGTGAYFTGTYAVGKFGEYSLAATSFERGEVIGETFRETGIGLVGFKTGVKGYDITEGLLTTRGRSFIEIPQGEYPTAPARKQLSLFQKNVYKEFGTKPGAFHTTGQKFWSGGEIVPQVGTSELPGLYSSTKISTPFTRISGSGAKVKWLPNVQDILSPPGKPGVAFLIPKKFRYSPAKVGRWYLPVKRGYADVPLIKAEIEAVFRPEAGKYLLQSKEYYAMIKGRRVPIDVFSYGGKASITPTTKVFVPSSYTYYETPPVIDIRGSLAYSSPKLISYKSSFVPSSAAISSSFASPSSSLSSSVVSKIKSSIKSSVSKMPISYSYYQSQFYYPSKVSYASSVKSLGYVPLPSKPQFQLPKFPLPGFKPKIKTLRMKRTFKRTPSLAAAELGKVGKITKGEMTGLSERLLTKPLKKTKISFGPLGPFKLKKVKK